MICPVAQTSTDARKMLFALTDDEAFSDSPEMDELSSDDSKKRRYTHRRGNAGGVGDADDDAVGGGCAGCFAVGYRDGDGEGEGEGDGHGDTCADCCAGAGAGAGTGAQEEEDDGDIFENDDEYRVALFLSSAQTLQLRSYLTRKGCLEENICNAESRGFRELYVPKLRARGHVKAMAIQVEQTQLQDSSNTSSSNTSSSSGHLSYTLSPKYTTKLERTIRARVQASVFDTLNEFVSESSGGLDSSVGIGNAPTGLQEPRGLFSTGTVLSEGTTVMLGAGTATVMEVAEDLLNDVVNFVVR